MYDTSPPVIVEQPDCVNATLNGPLGDYVVTHIKPLRLGAPLVTEVLRIVPNVKELRRGDASGDVFYFYVVDQSDRLCGVVPFTRALPAVLEVLATVVRASVIAAESVAEAPVESVSLTKHIESVRVDESLLDSRSLTKLPVSSTIGEAYEFFMPPRTLRAVPVVDEQGRYAGCVTRQLFDDVQALRVRSAEQQADQAASELKVIEHQAQEAGEESRHAHALGAADPNAQTFFSLLLDRGKWTTISLIHSLMLAGLLWLFEDFMQRITMLACLIPSFLTSAECIGLQSNYLALHTEMSGWPRLRRALRRELSFAAILAVYCGVVIGVVATLWHSIPAGIVIFCGMALAIAKTSLIAHALPPLLRYWRIDPRVACGTMVLAAADFAAILLVFGLARLIL